MNSAQCLQAVNSAFPELDITEVHPLGEGWANWTFETPQGIVFRFPKNAESAAELDAITPLIEAITPQLSLETPPYNLQGMWQGLPFVGYEKIPGHPLEASNFKRHPDSQNLEAQLGTFLSQLHSIPMELVRQALPHSLQTPWLEECVRISTQCQADTVSAI